MKMKCRSCGPQVDANAAQLYPPTWQPAQPGAWSRYQVATTVRHENETSSSSIYAAAHPGVLFSRKQPCSCGG